MDHTNAIVISENYKPLLSFEQNLNKTVKPTEVSEPSSHFYSANSL